MQMVQLVARSATFVNDRCVDHQKFTVVAAYKQIKSTTYKTKNVSDYQYWSRATYGFKMLNCGRLTWPWQIHAYHLIIICNVFNYMLLDKRR